MKSANIKSVRYIITKAITNLNINIKKLGKNFIAKYKSAISPMISSMLFPQDVVLLLPKAYDL